MDNTKTGTLIKELRKEKGMTQKDIADLLHVTDKAVSKWERGLCAPDISLLEPLANALDVSIVELIAGERIIKDEHTAEVDANVKGVLDYSKNEIAYKTKLLKKKYFIVTGVCVAMVMLICLFSLWWTGGFNIIDRSLSPDETIKVIVYDKDITSHSFSDELAVTVRLLYPNKDYLQTVYLNCSYQGIWWSPDNQKYVISLKYDDVVYLALDWLGKNSESNLNAYLSMGVEMNELAKNGLQYTEKVHSRKLNTNFYNGAWTVPQC